MMKKLLLPFAALVCAFALAACCCSESENAPAADDAAQAEAEKAPAAPAPEPVEVAAVVSVDDDAFDKLMGEQADPSVADSSAELLCKEGFRKYFTPVTKIVFETDSDGLRYARIYGKMNELPFFEWLVTDEGPRPYRYRFILTGKNGVKTLTPVQTRRITPGDATRFSVKVPADCTAAALLLDEAE